MRPTETVFPHLNGTWQHGSFLRFLPHRVSACSLAFEGMYEGELDDRPASLTSSFSFPAGSLSFGNMYVSKRSATRTAASSVSCCRCSYSVEDLAEGYSEPDELHSDL